MSDDRITDYAAVEVTMSDEALASALASQENPIADNLFEYECEVCHVKEVLSEAEAYNKGWDYPPFMGLWGIVSPRTCPSCMMTDTAWWYIIQHQGDVTQMPENHIATVKRVLAERESHPQKGPSEGQKEREHG